MNYRGDRRPRQTQAMLDGGERQTGSVDATFYSDQIDFQNTYVPPGKTQPRDFFLDSAGRRAFRELRDLFKQSGKPLWCRASFQIDSAGKFKMNWGYDDCDENGFARFSEEEAVKRSKQLRKID